MAELIRFEIPGRLPSMNEVIDRARYNKYAAASDKKKQMEYVMFWIKAHRLFPIRKPVNVKITWYEQNEKRDLDNIAAGGLKLILDSLVTLGILPNDSRKWVKSIQHHFPDPDRLKPRIEVQLEEI